MARRPSAGQSSAATEEKPAESQAMAVAHDGLIQNTTKIVSSFVANNSLPASELPGLIKSVAETYRGLAAPESTAEPKKPAVPSPSFSKVRSVSVPRMPAKPRPRKPKTNQTSESEYLKEKDHANV